MVTATEMYTIQAVYAIFLKWPDNNKLRIMDFTSIPSMGDNVLIDMINPTPDNASIEVSNVSLLRGFSE